MDRFKVALSVASLAVILSWVTHTSGQTPPPLVPNTWNLTGDMVRSPLDHTATLLPNGKVLIVGGLEWLDSCCRPSNLLLAQLFDPNAIDPVTGRRGTFTQAATPLYPSSDHSATLLPNGKVLISGGHFILLGEPAVVSAAQIYDPATDTFTRSDGIWPSSFHSTVVLPDGKVLFIGGAAPPGVGVVNEYAVYDPATDSIVIRGFLPGAPQSNSVLAASPAAVLLPNGKVLLAGSNDGVGGGKAFLYDPLTDTFAPTGDMSIPRALQAYDDRPVAVLLRTGKVLVVGGSPLSPSAELYDPATGTFRPTGEMLAAPRAVLNATLLPDGRVLVSGGVTLPGYIPDPLAEIYDPATETWGATAPMNHFRRRHTQTLLADGTVLVTGGLQLEVISTLTQAEIYVPGPTTPGKSTPVAYVANNNSGTVSVIDTATNTVVSTIAVGGSPVGVALTPDGRFAYVTLASPDNTVVVIDTATNGIVSTIPLSTTNTANLAFTPDGAFAYVAGNRFYSDQPLRSSVILTTTRSEVTTIPIGGVSVAITRDGRFAYFSFNDGRLSIIDTATNTVSAQLPFGGLGIAMTPDGRFAYIAQVGRTVVALDLATNSAVATIPVGQEPGGVAITPDGRFVYVVDVRDGTVAVIATATNTVMATVTVGGYLLGDIAITPDGRFAYVANAPRDHVSVIDVATNTVVTTIPVGSMPNGIAIKGGNQRPVAKAGPDQTVHEGTVVTLDGSASSDPDGDHFTFAWSFLTVPSGSTATLSNPAAVMPTFTADRLGDYMVQLVVTDTRGAVSTPDTVIISTRNSAPVAAAGPDQPILVIGTTVCLNGTQSFDPDGDPITYLWSLASVPAGSHAVLNGANTATPCFVADVHGDYVISLMVTDSFGAASQPATVRVSFTNVKPVANAGTSRSVLVGETVTLDGSGSSDANGDPLTYRWALVTRPTGSAATIATPTAAMTSFVPDVAGTYLVQLIVNDGFVDSDPATIQIQAVSRQTKVIQDIRNLQNTITSLAPSSFKNANMRNALINKLNAVTGNIEAGNYEGALGQLQNDILGKTDGCANAGVPDNNDWIRDCPSQNLIYPPLLDIIAQVRALCGC